MGLFVTKLTTRVGLGMNLIVEISSFGVVVWGFLVVLVVVVVVLFVVVELGILIVIFVVVVVTGFELVVSTLSLLA